MPKSASRRAAVALVTAATAAFSCVAGLASPAMAAVSRPAGGVPASSSEFCGALWKNVHVPGDGSAQEAKILNDDFGSSTCLANYGGMNFTVTRSTAAGKWTEYPNISTGWEQGEEPDDHSLWKFPVKVSQDGAPWTDVTVGPVQPSSWYNASYDIWFNKTAQTPVPVQADGTELMIWIQHENVNEPAADSPVYTIDGMKWQVMSWIAAKKVPDVSWHYIAFVNLSSQQHTSANLALNPFFTEAEKLQSLSANWYLTSVDFGFEIPKGGVGLQVKNFSFGGLK
jgi:hypothetical protein